MVKTGGKTFSKPFKTDTLEPVCPHCSARINIVGIEERIMSRNPDNPKDCPYLMQGLFCFTKSVEHSYEEGVAIEDMWVKCPYL